MPANELQKTPPRPHCAAGNGGTRGYATRRGRGLGDLPPEASLRYGRRGYKGVRIAPRPGTRRLGDGGDDVGDGDDGDVGKQVGRGVGPP